MNKWSVWVHVLDFSSGSWAAHRSSWINTEGLFWGEEVIRYQTKSANLNTFLLDLSFSRCQLANAAQHLSSLICAGLCAEHFTWVSSFRLPSHAPKWVLLLSCCQGREAHGSERLNHLSMVTQPASEGIFLSPSLLSSKLQARNHCIWLQGFWYQENPSWNSQDLPAMIIERS